MSKHFARAFTLTRTAAQAAPPDSLDKPEGQRLPDGRSNQARVQAYDAPVYRINGSLTPKVQGDVNTVFQGYALFLHMSVVDSVTYELMVETKAHLALAREPGFAPVRKQLQFSGGPLAHYLSRVKRLGAFDAR